MDTPLDSQTVAKSRYRYVRVVLKGTDASNKPVEVVLGIELTPGVHVEKMYHEIRVRYAYSNFDELLGYADDDMLAARAEEIILQYWPKRSYFIEVGRGELAEWVQVYAP